MDWSQLLVIILSIVLAIFLILAIVLTVMLINITRQIKSVASSAQRTAEHIEKAASGISKTISPLFILRTIRKFAKKGKTKDE